jgi:DNA-binding XRE family transcriptional regulator
MSGRVLSVVIPSASSQSARRDGREHDGRVHGGAGRLRAEHGLSQTDLYQEADLHRTQIGRVENADVEPRLMTLVIIADTLGVSLDDLVRGLPVPKERKPPPLPKRTRPKRASS